MSLLLLHAAAVSLSCWVKSRVPEIVEPKQLIQSRVLVKRARLTVKAQLEPSHALVDRVASMAEEQSIYYLELSLCTSRETEVNILKKEPVLEFSADGSIRLQETSRSGCRYCG